jgi:hypothetical protein
MVVLEGGREREGEVDESKIIPKVVGKAFCIA